MQNNWRFLGTLGRVLKLLSGVSNLNWLLVIIHLNIITNLALGMLVVNDNPECDAEVRPRPWLDLQTSHWRRGATHSQTTHPLYQTTWLAKGGKICWAGFLFYKELIGQQGIPVRVFLNSSHSLRSHHGFELESKKGLTPFHFQLYFYFQLWNLRFDIIFCLHLKICWLRTDLVLHAAPINRHLQSIGQKTAGSSHLGLL